MREISDIKEIQSVLLQILNHFGEICSKNGLKYFLSNGTLLGAVKYGEMIPWDDDIDILMLREDYEKLISLSDIDNQRYRFICHERYPDWRMPYAKLTDTATVLKEGNFNFGLKIGLSVDIFPIDKWHPNKAVATCQAFYTEILKRLLVCSINENEFQTEKKGIKRLILRSIYNLGQKVGYKKIYNKIDRVVKRSYGYKEKYVGCVSWTCHLLGEIFPKEVFDKTDYTIFAGNQFPIPASYVEYLDSLYGDWRKELPPEKQHSNHNVKVWWKDAE